MRVSNQVRLQQACSATENTVKFLNFQTLETLCYNLPKIQTKKQNLGVVRQKDASGIAKCVDPDQTAPLGVV